MGENEKNMWMIRAGSGGYLFDEYYNKNIVAIGYGINQDLTNLTKLNEIKQIVRKMDPNYNLIQISITAGQLFRFKSIFKEGDYVITYDGHNRNYLVGEITGDYEYNNSLIEEHHHIRKVNWLKTIPRNKLSSSTRNILGVVMTIFEIPTEAKNEILKFINGDYDLLEEGEVFSEELENEKTELDLIRMDVITNAYEFIKDKILNISKQNMRNLVKGILIGMGYKANVIKRNMEKNYDIEASPDSLGLKEPHIKVTIQQGFKQVDKNDVETFMHNIKKGDKGVIISIGGFSDGAELMIENNSSKISSINLDKLAELITQYYEVLDQETKSIIPLTKIYWPI